MIEEEIKRWKAYKSNVVSSINAHPMRWYEQKYRPKVSFDLRIWTYCSKVLSHTDDHNLYEILGVLRFFSFLDRYTFKPKEVKKFFNFYEALKFSGTAGRQRYKLTPVQCFQFANIYGFWHTVTIERKVTDNNGVEHIVTEQDERRVIRDAYIFVPRKFSKTTQTAAMAVYDLFFGDNNSQAYVGSNSYNQAKICFDEIRKIVWGIDNSGKYFRVNREKITFQSKSKDGLIECLSGDAKTKDGLNASLVIMDEYAQARDTATKKGSALKTTLTSSFGARKNPLTVIITTASDVIDGPFCNELEGVKKVLRGEVENESIFASLFMPDAGDKENDPHTWAKVQPHIGVTIQSDYYRHEWERAQLSADDKLAFRTKLLNIFSINEETAWFTADKANSLLKSFDIDRIGKSRETAIAFDLSVHDDFSAVSYVTYIREQKCFYCHTDYYFPEGVLEKHPNRELYTRWREAGFLKFCKGDVINVKQIAGDILDRAKTLKVVQIGYDAYKAQELTNILKTMGGSGVLMPFPQTNGAFNLPVEFFEMLAYHEPPKIFLNNNPINSYCLTNCVIDEDERNENKKPMKASKYRKIDGTISMLMALGQLNSYIR